MCKRRPVDEPSWWRKDPSAGAFLAATRSGDSENRPTRLIRREISRIRPAMNFFVHLIARGMLG
jgi:hypothetical protein